MQLFRFGVKHTQGDHRLSLRLEYLLLCVILTGGISWHQFGLTLHDLCLARRLLILHVYRLWRHSLHGELSREIISCVLFKSG